MKTSYKLALAVCALIFTGSVVYWAAQKFGKGNTAEPVADAGAVDLSAPAAPAAPPAAGDAAVPAITVAPDAGAATLAPPPPPADAVAVTPPAAPAQPQPAPAQPAPAPAPAITEPVKTEPKPVAPKTTTAPKPAATTTHKTYAVRSGDTLTSISQKFFGDKNHTDEIYKANRKLIGSNPNALKVGMKLEIPAK